jgi:hypothetical protein
MARELATILTVRGQGNVVAAMRQVSRELAMVRRELTGVAADGARAELGLSRVHTRQHAGDFRALGRELQGVRGGLGRLTAPVAGLARAFAPLIGLAGIGGLVVGLHAGVAEASNLQSAMAKLVTEAGVKPGQLPALTADAKTVGNNTGYAGSTIADQVLFHVEGTYGKTDHPLSPQAAEALSTVIGQGAQIGGAPLEDVAKGFAGLGVTRIKGADGDPRALMGKLLSIVGAGGTMKMGDLADAIGTGKIPSLKALGLDLDQVGGALATATDNGRQASSAILDMTTSLMHVQKPTRTGQGVLAAMGMDPLQLARDLRGKNGLITMLNDLGTHLDTYAGGRKSEKAQEAIASIFGGSKGTGPVQLYLDQLPNLQANIDAVSRSSAQTFTQAWEVTSKTFAFQKARLVAIAKNAAGGIGSAILPELGKITGSLATFIGDAAGGPAAGPHTALDRANAADPRAPSAGARFGNAVRKVRAGDPNGALLALGLSGNGLTAAERSVADIEGLLSDTGRILTGSVLPVFKQVALLGGGGLMEGLHLLKDVTGFLADHSTTTKVLLDGLLAVMAAKTIGNGLGYIGALPGRLAAGGAAFRTNVTSGLNTLSLGTFGRASSRLDQSMVRFRSDGATLNSQASALLAREGVVLGQTQRITSAMSTDVAMTAEQMQRLRPAMSGASSLIGGIGPATAGAAGTVEQSAGRMRRAFGGIGTAIGGVGSALTGRGGMVGALGIAGSAFGGYEVGKSQGKGAGIVTGAVGGAMAGSVLGPEGAVAGGVIGGLAGFVGALNKSTTSLVDFGSAIDADKGKIGTNTQGALLDALGKQDPQALAILKRAGISGDALIGIVQRDRGDRGAESRDLLAATTDPGLRDLVKTNTSGGYLGTGLGAKNGADIVFSPILDVLTKLGNDLTLYNDKQSYASTFTPGNVVPTGPPGIGRMTARASGGRVRPGIKYLTADRAGRAEVFEPDQAGRVWPSVEGFARARSTGAGMHGVYVAPGAVVLHATRGMDANDLVDAAIAKLPGALADAAARQ